MLQSLLIPLIGLLAVLLVVALLYLWWSSAPASGKQTSLPQTMGQDGLSQPDTLQIVWDSGEGRVSLEYKGRRYRSLAEIIEPEVRDQIVGMLVAANQLTEGATEPTVSRPYPTTMPATSASAPVPGSEVVTSGSTPTDLAGEAAALLAPLSMAEQIDEVLQGLLARQPDLAGRSIHIRNAMDGGVRIEVDGRSFDGVGDITDAEARSVIQAAIQEWERRSS